MLNFLLLKMYHFHFYLCLQFQKTAPYNHNRSLLLEKNSFRYYSDSPASK